MTLSESLRVIYKTYSTKLNMWHIRDTTMPRIRLTFWDLSSTTIANLLERNLISYESHSYEYSTKSKLDLDHIITSGRLFPILKKISMNGYGLSTSLVYGEVSIHLNFTNVADYINKRLLSCRCQKWLSLSRCPAVAILILPLPIHFATCRNAYINGGL